jgi:hypothetical protein
MAGQLARLLAVLDRNCGLEHLRPHHPAWMRQLFVSMLPHLDVVALRMNNVATFK